jgi:hypothetical protein
MFYQLKPFIGSPTQIQQKLENLIPAVLKSLWKIKIKCISGGICITRLFLSEYNFEFSKLKGEINKKKIKKG